MRSSFFVSFFRYLFYFFFFLHFRPFSFSSSIITILLVSPNNSKQSLYLSNFTSIISILYLYFLSPIYLCIPMLPLSFLYSSNLVFLLFVFLPFSFTPFMLPFLTYFSLNLPFIHVSQYFPLTYLFSFFATLCSLFCSFRIILFFLTLLIDSYFFF